MKRLLTVLFLLACLRAESAMLMVTTNGLITGPSNFLAQTFLAGSNTTWLLTNWTVGAQTVWAVRLHAPAGSAGSALDVQTNTVPALLSAASLNLIPGGNVTFAVTNRGSTTDVQIAASIVGGAASMEDVTNVVVSYVTANATNTFVLAGTFLTNWVNAVSNLSYTLSAGNTNHAEGILQSGTNFTRTATSAVPWHAIDTNALTLKLASNSVLGNLAAGAALTNLNGAQPTNAGLTGLAATGALTNKTILTSTVTGASNLVFDFSGSGTNQQARYLVNLETNEVLLCWATNAPIGSEGNLAITFWNSTTTNRTIAFVSGVNGFGSSWTNPFTIAAGKRARLALASIGQSETTQTNILAGVAHSQ